MTLEERIAEGEAKYKLMIEDQKKRCFVSSIDEFKSKFSPDTRSLIIQSDYVGDLPNFHLLTNIEELSIYAVQHWKDLQNLRILPLKKLRISVFANEKMEKLQGFHLKELTILFNGENDGNRIMPDFSNVPNLERLELHGVENVCLEPLDKLSNLKQLKVTSEKNTIQDFPIIDSLKRLHIQGEIQDFSFLEDYIGLQHLILEYTGVSNLEVLWNMEGLERLEIYGGYSIDASPLTKLGKLKEVYIRPFAGGKIDGGDLKKKKNVYAVITDEDRDLERLKQLNSEVFDFSRFARAFESRKAKEEKNDSFSPYDFGRRYREKKDKINTIKEYMQAGFQKRFWEIEPWDLWIKEYKPDYKKFYLEMAFKEYPFLNMNGYMFTQLQKEMHSISEEYTPKRGQIMFIYKDMVAIRVELEEGEGKLIHCNNTIRSTIDDRAITNVFYHRLSRYYSEAEIKKYDYVTTIESYYKNNTLDIEVCVFPIILCIRSLLEDIPLCTDAVLTDHYSHNGKLGYHGTGVTDCYVAKLLGFRKMLYFGKNRKPDETYEGLEAVCCQTEEEIFENLKCRETTDFDEEEGSLPDFEL